MKATSKTYDVGMSHDMQHHTNLLHHELHQQQRPSSSSSQHDIQSHEHGHGHVQGHTNYEMNYNVFSGCTLNDFHSYVRQAAQPMRFRSSIMSATTIDR